MCDDVERMRGLLASLGVPGEVRELPEPAPTAVAAAAQLGCDVGAIANSMVFAALTDGVTTPVLVLVSGAHRADVKLLARTLGVDKIRRADADLVSAATGQLIGGVAPVGHPAPVPTYVDESLFAHDQIWAGAGTEHTMFATTAAELVRITHGTVIAVTA